MSDRYDNILLNKGNGERPSLTLGRRDFLKLAGFTLGGSLLAGCQQAKVDKAIPFLVKPEEITPGVSVWYATTCSGCTAGCGVLAKNRDGRPIKLEGIPKHPISAGGLCPVGQAHLLELYDSHRLMAPRIDGKGVAWDEVDREVKKKLDDIRKRNGAVRILSGTITSPTTRATIKRFQGQFKNARHVEYDALSCSAILDAHELTYGTRVLPHYQFNGAEAIVSFEADFLGTWISPVEFTAAYRAQRSLEGTPPKFSYHVQYESRLSLTGSNADTRIAQTPSELRQSLQTLAAFIAQRAGISLAVAAEPNPFIESLATTLWQHRGHSLVVCGLNDLQAQVLVNVINTTLGNYGNTVDIERPSFQRRGNDAALAELLRELKSGSIDALIVADCNPVYDLPQGKELAQWLKNVSLTIAVTNRVDETADAVRIVCAEPHALESWKDAEPTAGVLSITQPTSPRFGSTRTLLENLQSWMGEPISAYDAIRTNWVRGIFPQQHDENDPQQFWDRSIERGYAVVQSAVPTAGRWNPAALARFDWKVATSAESADTYWLVLYPTPAMFEGRHAHNPWLQELADPVTKVVWDNYVSVSSITATMLSVKQGDVVRVEVGDQALELPVYIQPGQHERVVAVALGYGRKGTDRFTAIGPQWLQARATVEPGELVGRNAAVLLDWTNDRITYERTKVRLTKTRKQGILACTQEHQSTTVPPNVDPTNGERRPIIQETTLVAFAKDPAAGSFEKKELTNLWSDDHPYKGYRWGMVIDLTACTGCSACVISCQAENNIPVVGKDEVYRNREMTWIRTDRYYDDRNGELSVAHQPMLCQHCGNAPCETVCPVLATVHSEEGLNQQIYNRCVGTRYCSNNCPYKVRHFNWFEYEHGDDMHNLVLNPDVTVRERGVMEKCSFCVQRIQEAKITAKKEGRTVHDGEIQPACAQSCPAQAIIFGDMNDPNNTVAQRMKDPRYYRVLEDLGVRPSVGYMTLVRNKDEHAA